MLFLIAQIKRFGTLNTTQKKRSPQQSTVLENIRKKTASKWSNMHFFFAVFLDFFQKVTRNRKKLLKKKNIYIYILDQKEQKNGW